MNIHRITLTVIDFDQLGADEIVLELENRRHHIIQILNIETRDIGEWDDKNPLNFRNTHKAEVERIFKDDKP